MRSLLYAGLLLLTTRAWAFPEMVRHGYVNCTACHTSLVGGEVLNEYGRALSRELLSQQSLAGVPSAEGDEKFAYGLIKTPPGLLLGANVRLLQTFKESKEASSGRFMIMQVDADGSYQLTDRWRVFAAVGRIEPRLTDPTARDFVSSPRHGLEYLFSPPDAETRFSIRGGRFLPAYGIAFTEHPFVTRRLLDFGPGQERYAGEFAMITARTSLIATAIFSQAENNGIKTEKGGIVQISQAVGDMSKVGINYYQTQRQDDTGASVRRIMGAYAYLGFSKEFYALAEVDRPESADQKWGLVDTLKLGYELTQGLHLIGVQEYANLNVNESNPKFDAYSVGVEWFPRPHWDLYALYRRERDTAQSDDFRDVFWLIGHFYL